MHYFISVTSFASPSFIVRDQLNFPSFSFPFTRGRRIDPSIDPNTSIQTETGKRATVETKEKAGRIFLGWDETRTHRLTRETGISQCAVSAGFSVSPVWKTAAGLTARRCN